MENNTSCRSFLLMSTITMAIHDLEVVNLQTRISLPIRDLTNPRIFKGRYHWRFVIARMTTVQVEALQLEIHDSPYCEFYRRASSDRDSQLTSLRMFDKDLFNDDA